MYVAKRGGSVDVRRGGRRPSLQRPATASRSCVSSWDRRQRADEDQIAVHYQPQLDARTGGVVGAEALVRWRHPELVLLSPAVFCDLVERHGLMVETTRLVVRKALEPPDRWGRAGHRIQLCQPVRFGPNLPRPGRARRRDAASHLDLADLVLEITETTLMSDPHRALQVIRELAARGTGISIDDYGTGHSSLAYLTDLPAAELKLDRTSTARLLTEPRTAVIVASTIDLVHSLRLRLVRRGRGRVDPQDAPPIGMRRDPGLPPCPPDAARPFRQVAEDPCVHLVRRRSGGKSICMPVHRIAIKLATLTRQIDYVFLDLGYNDAGGNMTTLATNVASTIAAIPATSTAAKAKKVPFGAATPIATTANLDLVKAAVSDQCAALGVPSIDVANWVTAANKKSVHRGRQHAFDAGGPLTISPAVRKRAA